MKAAKQGHGSTESGQEHDRILSEVSSSMDRRNGAIFLICWVLIFLSAPVMYVDIVQAALCHKLGAGPAVSNLPASAYLLGSFAPFLFSWLVPPHAVRMVVVCGYAATASLLFAVCGVLVLSSSATLQLAVVITQGFAVGLTASISFVYMWQCLKRGTTIGGRARALKFTYTVGPLAAVAGSLLAQFVLNHGMRVLSFPYDFAALYFVGAVCITGVATAASQYRLIAVDAEDRAPFLRYIREGIRQFLTVRTLGFLWLAYMLWYISLSGITNLSLHATSLGRDPKELSGLSLALRFGFKAMGGFGLGAIAARLGMRAPIIITVCLLGAAPVWAALAPGYSYLLAFGLMGAGELGGVYFPNYVVSFSSEADAARNLSILQLVTVATSIGPVLYGSITQALGFPSSLAFGVLVASLSLVLVTRLPQLKNRQRKVNSDTAT
jgi:MFS family permease